MNRLAHPTPLDGVDELGLVLVAHPPWFDGQGFGHPLLCGPGLNAVQVDVHLLLTETEKHIVETR